MPRPTLRECPFCGAEAEQILNYDYDEMVSVVRCTECPAFVRIADDMRDRDLDRVEAGAVAAWNRRAGEHIEKRNLRQAPQDPTSATPVDARRE